MKKLLIIVLVLLAFVSCKHTEASKCGPCPAFALAAPIIGVRIVDKTSGADLFLSPDSPYKLSDLKVTGSADGNDLVVDVDSTDKANRFVKIIVSPQTFKLKLGDLAVDSIRVVMKIDSPKCCSIPKIHEVDLNNTVVCSACGYNPMVIIKK